MSLLEDLQMIEAGYEEISDLAQSTYLKEINKAYKAAYKSGCDNETKRSIINKSADLLEKELKAIEKPAYENMKESMREIIDDLCMDDDYLDSVVRNEKSYMDLFDCVSAGKSRFGFLGKVFLNHNTRDDIEYILKSVSDEGLEKFNNKKFKTKSINDYKEQVKTLDYMIKIAYK